MALPNRCFNYPHMGFLILTLIMDNTQARIGYFWHVTDIHLDTIYSTEGDVMRSCWRIERQPASSSTHSPGRYGDYLCDSPWSLIESAAKAMKSRQGDNVEFVLWTGDGLSHSAHPMSEMKKLEILRNITDLLGRTFSSQFVFPVLGHEDGTTTNFRHMGELWRHWLPTEALHTFEKGGFYSIEQTKSRLRIIALNTNFMRHDPKYSQSHLAAVRQRMPSTTLNTGGSLGGNGLGSDSTEYKNYYYQHNNIHQHHGHASDWSSSGHGYGYNSHHRGINVMPGGIHYTPNGMDGGGHVSALSEFENQDTEKQWIWLEEVLSNSKLNKETVYIVGHIPPGSDERHIGLQQNGHTTFTESNNKRYLELVRKYSSIIQGQFFGHLHSDSFRIIYDDKGKPVSWIMISPSVTPRKMSVGSNNPAMRLYKFDTDSGQVLDYTQYYMDLQLANTLGEPNWVPEYNLTHYYGLSDISAISLHNFVDRFTSNDGSWFAKYYRANTVRYLNDNCEGVCMLNHYCAITRVDYKEFRQCLEKEQSALRSGGQIHCSNDKLIFIVAMIFAIFSTFLQSLSYSLSNCFWLFVRFKKLKYIKKYLMYEKVMKICTRWIKMVIRSVQYNEIYIQKNLEKKQFYNIRPIEIPTLQSKQLQKHNCFNYLQQKPMSLTTTKDKNATVIKADDKVHLPKQSQEKLKSILLKYMKTLYTVYTKTSKLLLRHLDLVYLLIVYRLNLLNLAYFLILVNNNIYISNRTDDNFLTLTTKRCSKIYLIIRYIHHVVLHFKLI